MKHAYRICFAAGNSVDTTAETITEACENVKNWPGGQIVSVTQQPETPDSEVSSTPLINSTFTFIRMASNKLWLHNSKTRILANVSDQEILNVVDNHITHLECHIDGLNRELENLKQKIYELVRDQPKSARLQQLRELCGYIENGTDTPVVIFQDDATKSWCVRVGHSASPMSKIYTGATIALAIQNAYNKHPK